MANQTSNRANASTITRMTCETCGEHAPYVYTYFAKDIRVRVYQCSDMHRTKVFVGGVPRPHDPEAHLRKIKEIIAGRYNP